MAGISQKLKEKMLKVLMESLFAFNDEDKLR
jgi:hypothetical protein